MTNTEASSGERRPESVQAPSITLPKGGGAVQSIGEKFTANPVTGTGAFSVPVPVSKGRGAVGPSLSVSYDSGSGNGPLGVGWRLSVASISRKTDKGLPRYDDAGDSDDFVLAASEDLVPVLEDGRVVDHERVDGAATWVVRRYRPRVEAPFARIERWTKADDPGDVHWRSISGENVRAVFGADAESRLADPADPGRIFRWLLCRTVDVAGNAAVYEYKAEDSSGVDGAAAHERNRSPLGRSANRYLKRIRYGNLVPWLGDDGRRSALGQAAGPWLFEVVFDYGDHEDAEPTPREDREWPVRPDPFSSYRAGFEVRTYRRCRRVLVFHHFPDEPGVGVDCLVNATTFGYEQTEAFSVVNAITNTGFKRAAGGGYLSRSIPPVEFGYSRAVLGREVRDVTASELENLPVGLGADYQWVDLDGEGVSGVLTEQGGAVLYARNRSPLTRDADTGAAQLRFSSPELLPSLPAGGVARRRQFLDLAGDGRLDVVELDGPAPGFYERTDAGGWETFRPFESLPNLDWADDHLRFLDLTGDGRADVLVTDDDVLTWFASEGEAGYAAAERVAMALDEERGPRVVFSDDVQTIFLTDLAGDGLTAIARVRNGEVCYWPNLGWGRFGAKVTMDRSPWFDEPDRFDPRRIRFVDVDGSGMADLLYLGAEGARLWYNRSGNAWSDPHELPGLPGRREAGSVTAVDLLGDGTACLVWSSSLPVESAAPMRYVRLMAEGKPHLLTRVRNNLGTETTIRYAPSTSFYRRDEQEGRPWLTRLPFPVHVVDRVEAVERATRVRYVKRFAYHHGYFDGVEREFRGFGMVEQWDTEEFDGDGAVPPTYSRTWFHTGVASGRDRVSRLFEDEYYLEPGDHRARLRLLEDTVLPAGLTPDEEREACRSLKGSMLRQEVYGLDGSERAEHPYTVREQNLGVRMLQPRGPNRHAVFLTWENDAVTSTYDRNPADPRLSQSLTIEVDDYGTALRSAAVSYGRRGPDGSLPTDADRDRQTVTAVLYTERRVTNAVDGPDDHRTPVPCETSIYELTGFDPADTETGRFVAADFDVAGAVDVPYEVSPSAGRCRRLVTHNRTAFRSDDFGGMLPVGEIESLGLAGETFSLALTDGLVDAALGEVLPAGDRDAVLRAGGFVRGNDGGWWIPTGRVFYSARDDGPDAEREEAFGHFMVPRRYRSPFHTDDAPVEATVEYDAYDLLAVATRDPIGNTVVAEHDYRVLQPWRVTDPNGNRTACAFDALGMVVGTALMGKSDVAEGDSLDGFDADLTDEVIARHFDDPTADPHAILGRATSRLLYDLFAFQRTQDDDEPQPPAVYALGREVHGDDASPVQCSFSYSDGAGREVQKKVRAEPEAGRTRWLGSSWTVLNNKGKPIRQYEPFFTSTHRFERDVRVGVSRVLFYDPIERLVGTLHPDYTWEKVVFAPWRHEAWDAADTALVEDPATDPDVGGHFARLPPTEYLPTWFARRRDGAVDERARRAAEAGAVHAATPTVTHIDSLGRSFLTVTHNRFRYGDGEPVEERTYDRVVYDVEGNELEVRDTDVAGDDAAGRAVMRCVYDLTSVRIHEASMESGRRWRLDDVAGGPYLHWDDGGRRFRSAHDALRRPTDVLLAEEGGPERLIGQTVYGESLDEPEAANARGKVVRVHDQAGVVERGDYDFKGNARRTTRRLAVDYRSTLDWSGEVELEDAAYTTETAFDAMNRPVQVRAPDGSVIRPTFNEANLFERVDVQLRHPLDDAAGWTSFVAGVSYDAKGQRTSVDYGNGVRTKLEYDPLTWRLARLVTRRVDDGARLQDLSYTYDAVGFVVEIVDEAQEATFFRNQRVEPGARYTYDAVGRLIEATGREHLGQVAGAPAPHAFDDGHLFAIEWSADDGAAMGRYLERYVYDAVGNLLELRHRGSQPEHPGWRRTYSYEEASALDPAQRSNRLSATTVGSTTETYSSGGDGYTPRGQLRRMPHLHELQWDHNDRLRMSQRQAVAAGDGDGDGVTGERTWYVYDAAGERVRKVTDRAAAAGAAPTRSRERIYLGGFEVYREFANDGVEVRLERETLHVLDDRRRVAEVETRTEGEAGDDGAPAQLVRYRLTDHLGTPTLEVDERGRVVSYEELTPFGSTAYLAVRSRLDTPKRYRFTGQERDEETGFTSHGARYYAPWLGRWTSADPAGLVDGTNLYAYVRNHPTAATDPTGMWEWPSWRTVAIVAAVVVVAVVVTVATAGVGTAAVGAAVAAAGGAGTAAGATVGVVGTVAVAAGAGAAGSVAATATSNGLTGRNDSLGDAAISGAAAGVVTLGVGAAVSSAARGTLTASQAAVAAGTATTTQRVVSAAGNTGARVATGAPSGLVGGLTYETTRQVASGEASARGGLDGSRILTAGGIGLAGGAVLSPIVEPLAGPLIQGSYNAGLRGGTSVRASIQLGRAADTGQNFLIGNHGEVSGRTVCTVATPNGPRAFYQRSGGGTQNQGGAQAGDWSPFEGFSQGGAPQYFEFQGQRINPLRLPVDSRTVPPGWFVKDRINAGLSQSDPLFKWGSQENFQAHQWLQQNACSSSRVRSWQTVQGELEAAGVHVRDPVVDPPYHLSQ